VLEVPVPGGGGLAREDARHAPTHARPPLGSLPLRGSWVQPGCLQGPRGIYEGLWRAVWGTRRRGARPLSLAELSSGNGKGTSPVWASASQQPASYFSLLLVLSIKLLPASSIRLSEFVAHQQEREQEE
jgi:hypothetical protein